MLIARMIHLEVLCRRGCAWEELLWARRKGLQTTILAWCTYSHSQKWHFKG